MLKQTWTALRALLILTLLLGVAYPLAITAVGQLALPAQANGSLVTVDGEVVGSALVGQAFTDADGAPLPEWFQSRPSAAGGGYDGGASSGSNYGPENEELIGAIGERQAAIENLDGVSRDGIPADARGLDEHAVRELVESMIQGRDLGYLGEPTVTVLTLNIALAEMD
jgi:K+-transporting ATPase ATPase C chain